MKKTIITVLILSVFTFAAWQIAKMMLSHQNSASAHQSPDSNLTKSVVMTLGPLHISPEGRSLTLIVNLVLTDDTTRRVLSESPSAARDAIVEIVNRKTFDQLEGSPGAETLKKDIMKALNSILKERNSPGSVSDVYFNSLCRM